METSVYNVKGQEQEKITLPEVFETKISSGLLYEVTTAIIANKRAGTASTKTRGEVSGGGKKPWKQKGTGNARSGSNRSPLWRKGGIIFGPKPRNYYQRLPAKKKQLAFDMALSERSKNGDLVVLDVLAVEEAKTKKVAAILKNLKLSGQNILMVVDKADKNLRTASRNIEGLVVAEASNVNTYQLLWARKVVVTKAAIEILGK